jgi:FkbM family methyltransferase
LGANRGSYGESYFRLNFRNLFELKVLTKVLRQAGQIFERLPFRYQFMKLVGLLGLRGALFRLYCRCFGPAGGILQLDVAGKSAKFYVYSQHYADWLKTLDKEGYLLELLIRNLHSGDCFYDVGAEIGLYTLLLAKVVGEKGKIIAFEPEDSRYERVRENLKLNSLRNVRLFHLALGSHSGEGKLYIGRVGVAPGLIDTPATRSRHQITQKVEVTVGDRFVEMGNLPQPRAVKIDVEGYEYSVIKGLQRTLSNRTCEIACCEIHPIMLPKEITSNDVIDLFKSYGFNRIETYHRGETFHAFCYKD